MIASKIKTLLKEKGMSQTELAADVGISSSALSQILSGKTKPRNMTLKAIANSLGVAVQDLEAKPVETDIRLDIKTAAKFMNKSEQFVRIGLQRNLLPFGVAVKTSSKYTYYISCKKFSEYTGVSFE